MSANQEKSQEISEEDNKYNKDVNRDCRNIMRKEGWDICISSSIEYDKSLILLSTAALGFVFGIKNFGVNSSSCMLPLIFVLVLLLLAILSSLLSFWFDQMHGEALMIYADLCYIDGKEEYRTKKPCSYYASLFCKIFSGTLFFLSLVLLSIIFIINSLYTDNIQQAKTAMKAGNEIVREME